MIDLKTIRRGSRGTYVELLQLGLFRAGFLDSQPDGIFGQLTEGALIAFQNANGLVADGIAGAKTWSSLMPYLKGYVTHKVKYGETLYRLSQKYYTSLRKIEIANPNIDPFNLQIGQELTIPLSFDVVPTNISFTPTVLDLCVDGLSARYPFLAAGIYGKSVMGNNLYFLKLGYGDNEVFYNASHHGNEWITSTVLMKFIENYASAYGFSGTIFGQSAESLFNLTTLYIMPMVNPDGVSIATGELTDGEYFTNAVSISANYPSIPFPTGWKANILGVDPNLQYPAGWDEARAIKFSQGYTSPAPRDYVGSAPLEIPESLAVYNFTLEHNFTITLSYHAQGRVIYWRYLNYLPQKSYEIAQLFSSVSGYAVEETPSVSGYAGYKDWFILNYNRPGYTIEVGSGTSPLPLSQFDEIYTDNLGILVLALTATL